jgi:SusD/RagB-like outer membrane lipoprotein
MTTSRATATALLVLLFAAAGCDFLATEPKGELTNEGFFKTADHAIQATNATYNMLREWRIHVFSWLGLTEIASDDATKGSTPGDASFLLELDNLQLNNTSNLAYLDPWNGYYHAIYRANVAITNIPGVSMDAALKARLIGENKFLRAYFYFFLVRAYGGVPLIDRPLRPGEYIQPRATADSVYNFIVQDLLDAIAVLPEKSQYAAADMGRATKGAARGLLAQVYLFRKQYDDALIQAQAIETSGQYSLYSDYTTLFTRAGENSSESIFEVQAASLATGGAGSQYGEVQGVRGTPNIGWGFNNPSDGLEGAYEPGDPRLEATILYAWEQIPDASGRVVYLNPSMQNNRYNQKVFISPENPLGSGNGGVNIRRVRYADILLIAAEASYQKGNIGPAQSYLNQVRARARGGHTRTLGFTAEPLAESIAQSVLGLAAGTTRVAVRYVKTGSAAATAGLRNFRSHCADGTCASAAVPPIRVDTLDLVQTVDGSTVTTVQQFQDTVDTKAAGTPVVLGVLRVTQDSATGTVTVTPTAITINAQVLLPDVTATGQALLDAIWQERRVELGMEQHRWFDIIRQDGVVAGRAATLMAAVGKTFQAHFVVYPIPASEVLMAGLTQNTGY